MTQPIDRSRWSSQNWWILALGLLVSLAICVCLCAAAYLTLAPAVNAILQATPAATALP